MKSNCRGLVALIATLPLVVGCASTPNISFDKSNNSPVATVVLLRVNESQQILVRDFSGLPALGGVVGATVAAVSAGKRTEAFLDAYNSGSVRLSASLVSDLQNELASTGKQVSYLADEVAKIKNGVDDYSHIQTDKDAILSVWFGPVGYIADGPVDAPYEPWVIVHVRLLQGKSKQVLFQKTYTAGYKAKIDGAVFVPCASSYRFDTFDALMADFSRSTEALSECEKAIARQAAQDLA